MSTWGGFAYYNPVNLMTFKTEDVHNDLMLRHFRDHT